LSGGAPEEAYAGAAEVRRMMGRTLRYRMFFMARSTRGPGGLTSGFDPKTTPSL
jgi:hypothetical protein